MSMRKVTKVMRTTTSMNPTMIMTSTMRMSMRKATKVMRATMNTRAIIMDQLVR